MLIPAERLYVNTCAPSMKKRKHLDGNYDCSSARLVRIVKCVKKSICDRCMSVLMNGVRVYVCDLIMCFQPAIISVHETERHRCGYAW